MEDGQLFSNEAKINHGKAQWQDVSPSDLSNFPNNCIGYLTTIKMDEEDHPNFGTGFLISPTLVLTAAHTFQKGKDGKVFELQPDYFSTEKENIKVKDFKVNLKFVEIIKEIAILQR